MKSVYSDSMYIIHHGDIARAEAVHRQIPEFDPEYIHDNQEERLGDLRPYIIVCEADNVDAGYMIAYETPDSVYLWLTGTLPEYRKKGVFKLMLEDLINEVKSQGHNKITVKSYERFDSMLRALGRQGFKKVGNDGSSIIFEKNI